MAGRALVLALGGGGARGFAHAGVLRLLAERGVKVAAVAGVSAGAIAGAAFALGVGPNDMRARVEEFSQSGLAQDKRVRVLVEKDAGLGYPGGLGRKLAGVFTKGKVLKSLVLEESVLDLAYFHSVVEFFLPPVNIEDMDLPFMAVATDMDNGLPVALHKGSLREAVLASCAVPGACPAVSCRGRRLMDGGVVCMVPAMEARERWGGPVLAVDVCAELAPARPDQHAFEAFLRSTELQSAHLNRLLLAGADAVVRPELEGVHWADFSRAAEMMDRGYAAAGTAWPQIEKLTRRSWLSRLSPKGRGRPS